MTVRKVGGSIAWGLAAVAGGAAVLSGAATGAGDPYAGLPSELVLSGVVRDFRERQLPGGHPDMELDPAAGFGHYIGMVQDELDDAGDPVFASTGYKVSAQCADAQGNPIIWPRSYIAPKAGDKMGTVSGSQGGAVTSADSMYSWFKDVPGTNMNTTFPITLKRIANTNKYFFDDKLDTHFADLEGFFLVNDQLYGNSQGGNKNFHFTYEVESVFTYLKGQGQTFAFNGDDDVWVFIDGKLVIDLGGIHGKVAQRIELDRLTWLEDRKSYSLKLFFAERHRATSNFRIETTLNLKCVEPPAASSLYD